MMKITAIKAAICLCSNRIKYNIYHYKRIIGVNIVWRIVFFSCVWNGKEHCGGAVDNRSAVCVIDGDFLQRLRGRMVVWVMNDGVEGGDCGVNVGEYVHICVINLLNAGNNC